MEPGGVDAPRDTPTSSYFASASAQNIARVFWSRPAAPLCRAETSDPGTIGPGHGPTRRPGTQAERPLEPDHSYAADDLA